MYHYAFLEKAESLVKEATNRNIKVNQAYYQANFVLTEKNLLIFYDINRGNVLRGRGVQVLPDYELLFQIPLQELTYQIEEGNLLLLINGIKVNCYDFDLEGFVQGKS